jgi:xylose isomerase
VDASPDHDDPAVYEKNFHVVIKWLKERQEATGVKLLWNTSNLFSHPRYRNGAATNPDFRVVTRGAFQVKTSLEASVELGASNYVFWGGREGYSSLWNTNMKREQEHMARFLMMARDYGRSIGFKGVYLIEPKPMEPSKHQYDFDAATVIGFLRAHGLDKDFKLNLEANHATLAGHEFAHDLQVAADAGLLGSIDANRGDPQNGWDTDQFPNDLYETTKAMLVTLGAGGIGHGGFNFDAKVRRSSTDLTDLFEAHIAGMDAFAVGLVTADRIRSQGKLGKFLSERYASFDSGAGADFEKGKLDFKALAALAHSNQNLHLASGKEEWIEALINQALLAK